MRKRWNNVAADYDVIWQVPDYTPIILDVTTGAGIPSLEAGRKIGEHGLVLGIDYSKPMLKKGLKKARRLDFTISGSC